MLQQALKYRSLGLSVIPLKPRGKEPLIPWAEFQHRLATEEEIHSWFAKTVNANIGIVTGTISGVVVVDLDGPEGISSGAKLNLQSLCVSLTGNGKHLWYKLPSAQAIVQNAVRIHPGTDVRGESGYVVAPPSIHESGKRYRWRSVLTDVAKLPLLPKVLIPTLPADTKNGLAMSAKPEGWVAKALQEMKIGNIDDTLVSILGRFRRDGWSSSDARILLRDHAIRAGATEGHLEAKIENIWNRYPAKDERNMRLYASGGESLQLSSVLVIHSPTNPDSVKQYEQFDMASTGPTLNSGYPKLDALLTGGLKSSRLFTLAARTGTGKTNWIIGVSRTVCEAGKRVLLFSTETPYSEIWNRYKATLANSAEFNTHAFYVCDSFAPNLERVEEAIREVKPDLFIFDHINHVSEGYAELGAFMQGLNFLTRKYECAGIVTAQLNRSADWVDLKTGEKVIPRMSMIKGSGTIEQASSRVLLLAETRVLPEYTEISGVLDKNDNGPKGMIHFGLYNNPWRMAEL